MTDIGRRRLIGGLAIGSAQFVLGRCAHAQGMDPALAPVQVFYDTLMDAMRHADTLQVRGRYDRLEPTILQSFDVPRMTRDAVGGAFNSFSAADQAGLRTAFGKLLVATFAKTFDNWKGERFVIDPVAAARGGDRLARTQFIDGDASTDIDYLMHLGGGSWRIIDIYLNGTISQIATWRAQYSSLSHNGGPQALLHAVDLQTAKFLAAN